MNIDEERVQVWAAIHVNGDRITQLRDDMHAVVKSAVQEAMPRALMTDDEHRWVKLAIAKEAQSIAFRNAVISKTLAGLAWAMIVWFGYIMREYAAAHGWKP